MRHLVRVAPPIVLAIIACSGGRERAADSARGMTAAAVAESASATAALAPGDTTVRGDSARRATSTITPSSGGAVTTPAPRAPGARPAGAVSPTSTAAATTGAAAAGMRPATGAAGAATAGARPATGAAGASTSAATAGARAGAAPAFAPSSTNGAKDPAASMAGAATPRTATTGSATTGSATTAAQTTPAPAPAPAAQPAPAAAPARTLPFGVGEHLEYQVKFGFLGVGHASMDVVGSEEVRGTRTLHTLFRVNGGIRLYSVNDRYESWFDPRTMASLRFAAQIDEGSYERERRYEIFPDRRVYTENGGAEQPSVADPLDDGSFVYFVRDWLQHNAVEVGKEYSFDRYFRPDRNPVRLRVLRREQVKVPAGTFQTVVVQPIIKTTGIFGEGGKAQIWFTDDSTRTMVQMKSSLKFGSLSLYLTKRAP